MEGCRRGRLKVVVLWAGTYRLQRHASKQPYGPCAMVHYGSGVVRIPALTGGGRGARERAVNRDAVVRSGTLSFYVSHRGRNPTTSPARMHGTSGRSVASPPKSTICPVVRDCRRRSRSWGAGNTEGAAMKGLVKGGILSIVSKAFYFWLHTIYRKTNTQITQ